MKSLICSDIHDNLHALNTALEIAENSNCASVICCGDLCSPFVLDEFHKLTTAAFHVVFGNNDGDRFHIRKKAEILNLVREAHTGIMLHGEYLIAEKEHTLPGIPPKASIAVTHYTDIGRVLFASNKFDLVCCGHTHIPLIEKNNGNILANPGSLMGFVPGANGGFVKSSCLILNWDNGEIEMIEW
jgi:putative phosphoesterase